MTSRGDSGGGGLTPAGRIIVGIFVLGVLGAGALFGFKALSGVFGEDDNKPAVNDNTDQNNTPVAGKTTTGGSTSNPTQATGKTATPQQNLPKIQVGTLGYGTYLSAIGATKYAQERGINIELVDLGGQEGIQCDWVAGRLPNDKPTAGVTRILFTTHNAVRVCEGVKIAMVIDQSSGADMIITRSDVTEFSQIFANPVTMAGECSVSEYLYKTVAWAFGATGSSNLKLTPGPDPAVQNFKNDASIKTIVSYVPNANDALSGVSGSKKFLTTENWAGILDVAVIKAESGVNPTVQKFLAAWFDFVKLESENFDSAWKILDDYHKSNKEETFIGPFYPAKEDLKGELENLVAQASFADNIRMLVTDTKVLEARLSEVDSVQKEFPCSRQGSVPAISTFSPKEMLDGRYIQALQSDSKIANSPKTISKRRVTLSTSIQLETAVGGANEKLVGQLSAVFIEFNADSDEFKNENEARDVIGRNFIPILRLTNNSVIELVGGFAQPKNCAGCKDIPSGTALAIKRATHIRQLMIDEYGIDPSRIRVSKTIRPTAHVDTSDPALANLDRRVDGKLIIVGGQ